MAGSPTPAAPSALRDLARVRTPDHRGVYASTGELFRDAIFARDAIEVAEDLIESNPEIVREVIITLAALQGTTFVAGGARSTEEEVGRIHHESRRRVNDGRVIDAQSQELLEILAAKWGGNSDGVTYYGSVDATPLFVRLVDRYCSAQGSDALLDETLMNRDGASITVREAALAASRWVAEAIERSQRTSGLGILEHQRRNPRGMEYQSWRDGRMSLLHPARVPSLARPALPAPRPFEECGELVNPDRPYAPIEVQGVAFDALNAGARLAVGTPDAERFGMLATSLRTQVFAHYWMPAQQYFATAIDRDATNAPRQVATITAAAAELLDSTIFDDIDAATRERYVTGLVRCVTSKEMLTAAGIRATSLRHRDQLDHVAYQGVFTVWHKQTWDIAKGLRRHGFGRVATQLENRVLNTCNAGGENNEYAYVDGDGRVCLDPRNLRGRTHPDVIAATNIPDEGQAWTVSAVLAIKRQRGRRLVDVRPTDLWARRLEVDVMNTTPAIAAVRTRAALARMWQRSHAFVVDKALGDRFQAEFTRRATDAWRRGPSAPQVGLTA